MELRNRIVMSPMETMYGTPDGLPSDRTVAYFAARAAGGVGLITVGATGIDHQHPETPGGLHLGTDESRRRAPAARRRGARARRQDPAADRARRARTGSARRCTASPRSGPSVIPSYLTGRPSTEITAQQIAAMHGPLQGSGTPRPRGRVRRHRAARRARLHVARLVPRAAAQPAHRRLPRRLGPGPDPGRARGAGRDPVRGRRRLPDHAADLRATSGSPAGGRRTRPPRSRRCWSRPASTPSTSAAA